MHHRKGLDLSTFVRFTPGGTTAADPLLAVTCRCLPRRVIFATISSFISLNLSRPLLFSRAAESGRAIGSLPAVAAPMWLPFSAPLSCHICANARGHRPVGQLENHRYLLRCKEKRAFKTIRSATLRSLQFLAYFSENNHSVFKTSFLF